MRLVLRRLPSRLAMGLLTLAGLVELLRTALAAFGGKALLWAFDPMVQSRFTSMGILTGTLRLRQGVQHAYIDEQIYGGATYTNWGFGVPLLQAPFHYFAFRVPSHFPARFFPDRAIYAFYFAAMVPLLWVGFDRLLASRSVGPRPRRRVLSWAATLLAVTCTVYPLMSCRWWIYEETIAYFAVCELAALGAYLLAASSSRPAVFAGLGAAAGLGLLIRPTGLLYVGVWGALVILGTRRRAPTGWFAAGLAPLVGLWLWTNTVRSGSPLRFGLDDSTPWYDYHLPMLRFGSACIDSRAHFVEALRRMFHAVFVDQPTTASAWMRTCHFDFEARPPDTEPYSHAPFLGPVVFLLLAWMLATTLLRRERRWTAYVPIAAVAALLVAYTLAGAGLAWRYAGDFWPLLVLACAEYVRLLPASANRWLGLRFAALLAGTSAFVIARDITPALPTIVTAKDTDIPAMWPLFETYRNQMDATLPSHFSCGDGPPSWPIDDGMGWNAGSKARCEVSSFTNLYFGIPEGGGHTLRFEVDHALPTPLRVFVNGSHYRTRTEGNAYLVDVNLDRAKFLSPIVSVTIEWSRSGDPPPLHLRAVSLD